MNEPVNEKLPGTRSTAVPCADMTKHIFLTGAKGIGKSTLLKKILPDGKIGGFFTVKTNTVFPCPSVHLLQPGEIPTAENVLFLCGERHDPAVAQRFNHLGCAALAEIAPVLVMDELGPAEQNAIAFQQAVLQALDGTVPIYGVLQYAKTPFLQAIAQHPNVQVITVTADNRNQLAEKLKSCV